MGKKNGIISQTLHRYFVIAPCDINPTLTVAAIKEGKHHPRGNYNTYCSDEGRQRFFFCKIMKNVGLSQAK